MSYDNVVHKFKTLLRDSCFKILRNLTSSKLCFNPFGHDFFLYIDNFFVSFLSMLLLLHAMKYVALYISNNFAYKHFSENTYAIRNARFLIRMIRNKLEKQLHISV